MLVAQWVCMHRHTHKCTLDTHQLKQEKQNRAIASKYWAQYPPFSQETENKLLLQNKSDPNRPLVVALRGL